MNKLTQYINKIKLNTKITLTILLFTSIPLIIFMLAFFYIMNRNIINENMNSMSYESERYLDDINTKINSVNMCTQFFLSDLDLHEILAKTAKKETISTKELLEDNKQCIASLERLVNNNPHLYGVRVYASNDDLQEIMPILFNHSRMDRQEWNELMADGEQSQWCMDYDDNIFTQFTLKSNSKLIACITPVTDVKLGQIGTIEAAVTMEDMFPQVYEQNTGEWGFFVTDAGKIFSDDSNAALSDDKEKLEEYFYGQIVEKGTDEITYINYKKGSYIVSNIRVNELSGNLITVRNITDTVASLQGSKWISIIVVLLILVVLTFVIHFIVNKLLKQLYDVLLSIRKVQEGNLDVRIENCKEDEIGEISTQFNRMLERIRQLMDDNLKREMLMKNSEIRALQNQINAHFIYNVLETIKMMAEIDEEYEISDAITSLGKLLRYSMKWVSGNVLIEQEMEYIKNYMALINLRYDYEIYLSLNIAPEVLKQEIPKISLQPIIENAICHGIEELAEDTNIYIKGYIEGKDCVIEITDAGIGMSEEEVKKLEKKIAGEIDSSGGAGNGIGLKNVQDRIHIAFGENYGISIASRLGCFTKIIVKVPVTHQYAESEI